MCFKQLKNYYKKFDNYLMKYKKIVFFINFLHFILLLSFIYLLIEVSYLDYQYFISGNYLAVFLYSSLWLLFGLGVTSSYNILSKRYRQFKNNFILLTLFLIIGLIYFGQILIEKIYPNNIEFVSPDTYLFFSPNTINNTFVNMNCKSLFNRERPTVSDYAFCNISLTNNNDNWLAIYNVEMNRAYLLNDSSNTYTYPCFISVNKNKTDSCIIKFPLCKVAGSYEYNLLIPINSTNYTLFTTVQTNWNRYTCITEEAYDSWISQKYSLLATLVIGSIFSSILAIRNIMEVWDRKISVRKKRKIRRGKK